MLFDRRIYRQLGKADRGPVYTFDIDATYLDTRLANWKDVLRIPLELAIDKRPFPGIAELIRACQRGSEITGPDRPVFFVSASPSQMRAVLERRMELDELTVDGLTLKNWAHYVKRARFQGLTQQVPYKLMALLATRKELPPGASEVLFGDDTEADALIYSLYSAIVIRALSTAALKHELDELGALRSDRQALLKCVGELEPTLEKVAASTSRPIFAIFIHGIKGDGAPKSHPKGLQPTVYSSALVPAAALYKDGLIREQGVRAVYKALRDHNAFAAADEAERLVGLIGDVGLK